MKIPLLNHDLWLQNCLFQHSGLAQLSDGMSTVFLHVGQAGCQIGEALWPSLFQERPGGKPHDGSMEKWHVSLH